MHVLDLDKFEDSRIVARDAREGEKLVTLDGEERIGLLKILLLQLLTNQLP